MQQHLRGGKEEEDNAGKDRKRGFLEGRQFLSLGRSRPIPRSGALDTPSSLKDWNRRGNKRRGWKLARITYVFHVLIMGRLMFGLLQTLQAKKIDISIVTIHEVPHLFLN